MENIKATLEAMEETLSKEPFLGGNLPCEDDRMKFELLKQFLEAKIPNVMSWFHLIQAFAPAVQMKWGKKEDKPHKEKKEKGEKKEKPEKKEGEKKEGEKKEKKPKEKKPKEEKPVEAPKKEEAPAVPAPTAPAPTVEAPTAPAPTAPAPTAPAPAVEAPKAEEPKKEEPKAKAPEGDVVGEDDIFGDSQDLEAAQKLLDEKKKADEAAKKSAKKKEAAKSYVKFEVKVFDTATNLDELAKRIKNEIVLDGLRWEKEYDKQDIGYGIQKLVIAFIMEDEKINSTDDIIELITALDEGELVQSVDILMFNKL